MWSSIQKAGSVLDLGSDFLPICSPVIRTKQKELTLNHTFNRFVFRSTWDDFYHRTGFLFSIQVLNCDWSACKPIRTVDKRRASLLHVCGLSSFIWSVPYLWTQYHRFLRPRHQGWRDLSGRALHANRSRMSWRLCQCPNGPNQWQLLCEYTCADLCVPQHWDSVFFFLLILYGTDSFLLFLISTHDTAVSKRSRLPFYIYRLHIGVAVICLFSR